MNKKGKRHYLQLILASYILVLAMLIIKRDLPGSPNEFAAFLGSGLGVALIPLLVMRFIGNGVGWFAYALLSLGATQAEFKWLHREGSFFPSGDSSYRFQPERCGFSVQFPSKPNFKTYSHPELGDYVEALWLPSSGDSPILRTECIALPSLGEIIREKSPEDFILGQLEIYARNNGVTFPEYSYESNNLGYVGNLRGIKYLQGIPVTYKVLMVVGSDSQISLYAGGRSSTFPQKEILSFLVSLARVE